MLQRQVTENCHYISRFLTKPWEMGQRRLHFFDFDENAFDDRSSNALFAEDKLNSQEVENWLSKTIEGPLSICRQKLSDGKTNALDEWTFYRAATLMLWLQGMRVRAVGDHDARLDLATLAKQPLDDIDKLVLAIRQEYDLSLSYTVAKGSEFAPLFFPSTGLFRVAYRDTGCVSGFTTALALPLDLQSALLAAPCDKAGKRDISKIPASISNCSVGTSNARRVVVLPEWLKQQGEATAAEVLLALRASNDELLTAVNEAKELVVSAFDESGLVAPRDGAGRIIPRR